MKIFIGCSSKSWIDSKYIEDASYISKHISKKYDLVLGGVSENGMFNAILEGFRDKNIYLYTLKIYEEDMSKYHVNYKYVDSTFDRTKSIYNDSDKILILPGGTGSLAEIFSMLEEIRTIDKNREIIIYNQDGYYYDLILIISKLIKKKFNDSSILDYIKVFNNKEDLIKYLEV